MTLAQKRRLVQSQIRQQTAFKSKFEQLISNTLGKDVQYEPDTLPFVQPAMNRKYTPDFKLRDKVYIEGKGLFTSDDRKKMLWVKEQYPDHTFYMLFQNARAKLTKKSKTSYADWCDKNGFEWAHMPSGIPKEWL